MECGVVKAGMSSIRSQLSCTGVLRSGDDREGMSDEAMGGGMLMDEKRNTVQLWLVADRRSDVAVLLRSVRASDAHLTLG